MPTILLPSTLGRPLADFDALCAAVASWLHRSDLGLIAPTFVTLAEDRMNRALRVRQMEAGLPPSEITSGTVAMPYTAVGIKALWLEGAPNKTLKAASFDAIKDSAGTCEARHFAWQGDALHFDGTGTVSGVIYERIPALTTSNATNWLLTEHPAAYMMGCRLEAALYLEEPEDKILAHERRFDAVMAAINGADMRDRYAGPLVVRAR